MKNVINLSNRVYNKDPKSRSAKFHYLAYVRDQGEEYPVKFTPHQIQEARARAAKNTAGIPQRVGFSYWLKRLFLLGLLCLFLTGCKPFAASTEAKENKALNYSGTQIASIKNYGKFQVFIGVEEPKEEPALKEDTPFNKEYIKAVTDLETLFPNLARYPPAVHDTLMAFRIQFGKNEFRDFDPMIKAVKQEDWQKMTKELARVLIDKIEIETLK